MSENKRLSPKQLKAIKALLAEPTTRAAAKAASVSEATIWRWLADKTFQAEYQRARASLFEQAISRLQSNCETASAVLVALIVDKATPPSVRLGACVKTIELSLRAKEQLEIEQRLKDIEERLSEMPDVRHPRMRQI